MFEDLFAAARRAKARYRMSDSLPIIIELDKSDDEYSPSPVDFPVVNEDDDIEVIDCGSLSKPSAASSEYNCNEPQMITLEPAEGTNDATGGKIIVRPRPIVKKKGKKLMTKRGSAKGKSFLQFGTKAQDTPRLVKHFRRSGPSYNFKSDDVDVRILLAKFEQFREIYRKAKKREMEALKDFVRDYWNLLCNGRGSIDGNVPGIKVGMCFTWRTELYLVALHHRIQAGIDYLPVSKSTVMSGDEPVSVAVSVVVGGNFEDDVDEGERILYCGEGGRPYDGAQKGEQMEDQTLTKGNLALHNSAKLGRSVRVIRKHRDESSPSGYIYSYDGKYRVSRSFRQRGRSGALVYMFELNRLPNQGVLKW